MNREALPLIIGLLIPLVLVLGIVLYSSGYDVTLPLREFLKKIPILYYIIVLPVILGFIIAIAKWKEDR